MLKLLKKEEVNKTKELEKAKEIQEGLKISRRVDDLRELAAKEEQALEKFRIETLSAISKEISELDAEKEKALEMLKSLQEKAQKELSKTDKKRLQDFEKALNEREKVIKTMSFDIDLKEADIAIAQKEYADSLERQTTHEEASVALHLEANRRVDEAQQALQSADSVQKQAMITKDKVERELELRERDISERAKAMEIQWEENLRVSRELAVKEKQVADQRATLERAMARLRANRLA